MTAAEVRDALALRWPDSEYLAIPEAPTDSSRMGRKIDLLVISLWASRGFEREAVEVKVSYSDWTRERTEAAKADFWWRHSHRFWVAVPAGLAGKVKEELPIGWGLLACESGCAPKVIVKPARREAEALPWSTTIGVMRAAANAGVSALARAEARGRAAGREEGKGIAERGSNEGVARAALESLRAKVAKFEAASGVSLAAPWGLGDIGAAVAIVQRELATPGWTAKQIGAAADMAARQYEIAAENAKKLRAASRAVSDAIAAAPAEGLR